MRSLVLIVVLALVAACTKRNDAVCCTTDEDCDAFGLPRRTGCSDGEVCQGHLCVAAACTTDSTCPAEQPVCDLAAKICSDCAADNDCSRLSGTPHCDTTSGGCRACVVDEHCPAAAPVCDDGVCRTCTLDSECASQVCDIDTGSCVDASKVVYASETGGTDANCSLADPCFLGRAISVSTPSSTVRMLPGAYTGTIVETDGRVTIVATGARLLGESGSIYPIRVTSSGKVSIRGLEINTVSGTEVECRSSAGNSASLELRQVIVAKHVSLRVGAACIMRIRESRLEGGIGQHVLLDDVGGTLEIDRTHMFRDVLPLAGLAARSNVRVTNSVFENTSVSVSNYDTSPQTSTFHVAFNTFRSTSGGTYGCSSTSSVTDHPRMVNFDNNIIVTNGDDALFVGTTGPNPCQSVRGNIAFPQKNFALPAGNMAVDPQLVNAAAGDYRLSSSSPAIDVASPTTNPPDHDFDGTSRPQGAALDVGAFERKP